MLSLTKKEFNEICRKFNKNKLKKMQFNSENLLKNVQCSTCKILLSKNQIQTEYNVHKTIVFQNNKSKTFPLEKTPEHYSLPNNSCMNSIWMKNYPPKLHPDYNYITHARKQIDNMSEFFQINLQWIKYPNVKKIEKVNLKIGNSFPVESQVENEKQLWWFVELINSQKVEKIIALPMNYNQMQKYNLMIKKLLAIQQMNET